jgi:hypothetical protein
MMTQSSRLSQLRTNWFSHNPEVVLQWFANSLLQHHENPKLSSSERHSTSERKIHSLNLILHKEAHVRMAQVYFKCHFSRQKGKREE